MCWGSFAAECEPARIRISTYKFKVMVLDWEKGNCPLKVSGELLPQEEEFKNLGVLLTSKVKMKCETNGQIDAVSAVILPSYLAKK